MHPGTRALIFQLQSGDLRAHRTAASRQCQGYVCEQGGLWAFCSHPTLGRNGRAIYGVRHQVRLQAPLSSIPRGQCLDSALGQDDGATQSSVGLILTVPSGFVWPVIVSGSWPFFPCVLMRPFTCVKYTLSGSWATVMKFMFLHEGETART